MRIGLNRRSFLKLTGTAAGGLAAAEVFGPMALDLIQAGEAQADGTRLVSIVCNNNCGGRCYLKAHIKDRVIVRICTDESADSEDQPQLRGCLKGRALKGRFQQPGRLLYPMKRAGRRGEGKFLRISWDEAIETVAANLKRTLDLHGPASVYIQYGTGDCGAISGVAAARRLMNLLGGYLGYYNSYSSACLRYTAPFVTGARDTSSYKTLVHSRLIILNGFNPAETVFETNSNYYLARAREAGARIVVIDPRLTETAATFAHEWLPLKPTTDTALFLAMAHEIIAADLHDQAFLDQHCLGFDEEHMPKGVPEGLSFKNYVLGSSDRTPKTPEWAAPITGVEAAVIRRLAREYAPRRRSLDDACADAGCPGRICGRAASGRLPSSCPPLPDLVYASPAFGRCRPDRLRRPALAFPASGQLAALAAPHGFPRSTLRLHHRPRSHVRRGGPAANFLRKESGVRSQEPGVRSQ